MILVTGTSGFIGRHLLLALVNEHGPNGVLALTSIPVSECAYLLHNNYTFNENFFLEKGFDSITTIVHAGGFIPKSSKHINDWTKCTGNIESTRTLLAAKLPRLKRFILISTTDVYGAENPISESSRVEPESLYGFSKLYVEKMTEAWAKTNHCILQVLRLGHVYGPGEEAFKKVIPTTIQNLLNKQEVQLWGTGEEKRSFIFIKDVVTAIVNSIRLEKSIGVVNVVSSQGISIHELVQKLIHISREVVSVVRLSPPSTGRDLIFDNSKLMDLLLDQETPMEEGLLTEWLYAKQLKS